MSNSTYNRLFARVLIAVVCWFLISPALALDTKHKFFSRSTAQQMALAIATNVLWTIARDNLLSPALSSEKSLSSALEAERVLNERYVQIAPKIYLQKELLLETAVRTAMLIKQEQEVLSNNAQQAQ